MGGWHVMILPINDHYRLAADEHAWALQRSRARRMNGETVTVWESFKWYGSIQQAVNALGELMVRTSEAQTVADALAEVQNVTTTLTRALSPAFRVVQIVDREEAA